MMCEVRRFIFTVVKRESSFSPFLILTAFVIRSSAPTPTLIEECKNCTEFVEMGKYITTGFLR